MELSGVNSIDVGASNQVFGKQTLGQEDFMRLLLQELSYQDPLNPMDSKEFTVQLTQFSSLEGINDINGSLGDLLAYQRSMQNTAVTNMIGKTVTVDGSSSYLRGTADMSYDLAGEATSVKIIIRDAIGKVVRSEELGSQPAGVRNYTWDGKNDLGSTLNEGFYTFSVEALNLEGNPVQAETRSSGYVTGIDFDNGLTYVVLDGTKRVYLSDIKSIEE
jgi:flagellar basal-body rod modification protein FlgD